MSDPQPATLKPKPRRAEPLQPDLPGRGHKTGSPDSVDIDSPTASDDPSDAGPGPNNEDQSKNALDNVSKGYK